MSGLAAMAEEHWKTFRPTAYAAIEDPAKFFETLADDAQEQIDSLSEDLAETMRDGTPETFLETASRLNQARQAAEGQVLREWVLLPEEDQGPESDDSDADREFEEAVAEFQRLRAQFLDGD